MRLTATIRLLSTPAQATMLQETLTRCNQACNWISRQAWEQKTFRQFDLHHLTYRECRERFKLSAQATIRCIAKVTNAYKLNHKRQRHFRPRAAQPYDCRILRFAENHISIWTLDGRQKIPFICGDHQQQLLKHRKGESDLMLVAGKWYLVCSCDVPNAETMDVTEYLGVDLGIVNIAVDSDGTCHSGTAVEQQRRRHQHRRRNLQRKGTRSAKRKLQKISGKQARFQKDTNHCISKALVTTAERTGRGIALEDLKGIRGRVTARRRQRSRLSNWGFFQLRSFVEYKAKLRGVPVVLVDPRYTSQQCPACGHTERANRRKRDEFLCVSCGRAGPADHIAALNIGARAVVNQPMVAVESAVRVGSHD